MTPTTLSPRTSTFDLHRTADWLARQDLRDLDAHRADLVRAVDDVATAAGAPTELRPSDSDSTPTLVRLFNHHAVSLHRPAA